MNTREQNLASVILVGLTLLIAVLFGLVAQDKPSDADSAPAIAIQPSATEIPPTDTPEPTATPLPTQTPVPTVAPTTAPTEAAVVPTTESGTGTDTGTGDTTAIDPALVTTGQTFYSGTCSACHGVDAKGIQGLGKDLTTSEFVKGLTDKDLSNFIKTGRPVWDAANTTGIDMPPKGGNPALNDDQILAIIAYLRSIEE